MGVNKYTAISIPRLIFVANTRMFALSCVTHLPCAAMTTFTAHFVYTVTFLARTHPIRTLHFGHGPQVVYFSCLMVKWTATQTVGAI